VKKENDLGGDQGEPAEGDQKENKGHAKNSKGGVRIYTCKGRGWVSRQASREKGSQTKRTGPQVCRGQIKQAAGPRIKGSAFSRRWGGVVSRTRAGTKQPRMGAPTTPIKLAEKKRKKKIFTRLKWDLGVVGRRKEENATKTKQAKKTARGSWNVNAHTNKPSSELEGGRANLAAPLRKKAKGVVPRATSRRDGREGNLKGTNSPQEHNQKKKSPGGSRGGGEIREWGVWEGAVETGAPQSR